MSLDQLPVATEAPISSDEAKQEFAQKIYTEVLKDEGACEETLSRLKWSLSFSRVKGIPWNEEASTQRMVGGLRGFFAEYVGDRLPVSMAETVYSSREIPLADLNIISPRDYVESPTNRKGDVLGTALNTSFEEHPMHLFGADPLHNKILIEKFEEERRKNHAPKVSYEERQRLLQEYLARTEETITREFKEGMVYGEVKEGKGKFPAGEIFASTVIPDGILVNAEGAGVGVVEVKAYTADELSRLLELTRNSPTGAVQYTGKASDFGRTYAGASMESFTLGADVAKEVAFIDTVRDLIGGSETGGDNENNLIVLRFPADIPNNLLVQYGERIVNYGFPNVVIQKLPLSGPELDIIAKEIVKSRWGAIGMQLLKKQNFADREIKVLAKYVGIDTAEKE